MPDQCDYQVMVQNTYLERCVNCVAEKEPVWFDARMSLKSDDRINKINRRDEGPYKSSQVATG